MSSCSFERSALQSCNRLQYRNGWTHFFHEREMRDKANSSLQLGYRSGDLALGRMSVEQEDRRRSGPRGARDGWRRRSVQGLADGVTFLEAEGGDEESRRRREPGVSASTVVGAAWANR